jgi:deazaflavin-dependent oxidoreductase (nitroreductase family)
MLVSALIGRPEAGLYTSSPQDRIKAPRFMANWLMFTRAHCALYRSTRGLIGGNLLGIQVLLLTTRGRKTGLRRTLPLAYVEYKGDLIVVASNGGSAVSPAWWLNLQSAGTAEVQVNKETFEVSWSKAPQKERTEYWRKLQAAIPAYRMYRFQSNREIPILLLRRQTAGWTAAPLEGQARDVQADSGKR